MSSDSNNATTLAENKVLILYILNLIDADIRQDDLFKIITSINDINYFFFKQIITDLIDSKLVGTYTKDEPVIKITSEGKNAYILTQDVLPGILKLKADNIFMRYLSGLIICPFSVISKCRCGPLLTPVVPVMPTTCPCATYVPTLTERDDKC